MSVIKVVNYTLGVVLEQFTSDSFEPSLSEHMVVGEGSFFQLTCLEPKSLPLAKKWWQNSAGHTVCVDYDCLIDLYRVVNRFQIEVTFTWMMDG